MPERTEVRSSRYDVRVPQIHQLSQAAFDRLSAEHQHLITHGRNDIARVIQAARELGDLKENGDYHAAKDEQGKMEARISHLAALLLDCEIVGTNASGIVQAGSVVLIVYVDDEEEQRCLIGSIEERHDDDDVIVVSPGSPLGAALIGKADGDRVSFQAPGGELWVEIVGVEA